MSEANYRFTVRYDGRDFFGWQRNQDRATIQRALEQVITQVTGERAAVHGSGRTDRGAHAEGQVAHVRLSEPLAGSLDEVCAAINQALPDAIEVRELGQVGLEFHARESALAKQYVYLIWAAALEPLPPAREGRVWHTHAPLDAQAMAAACPIFIGEHDFASFAKRPNYSPQSTVRTVSHCALSQDGPLLRFEIRANGFLYKMVRNIVRAVARVGEGKLDREGLAGVLAACDRKAAPGTAPASGLYLERVFYAGDPV